VGISLVSHDSILFVCWGGGCNDSIQNGFSIQDIRVFISGSTTVRCGLRKAVLASFGMKAEYTILQILYLKKCDKLSNNVEICFRIIEDMNLSSSTNTAGIT